MGQGRRLLGVRLFLPREPVPLFRVWIQSGHELHREERTQMIAARTMLISAEHASRPGVIRAMALLSSLTVADSCASLLEGSEGKRLLVQRGL